MSKAIAPKISLFKVREEGEEHKLSKKGSWDQK